MNHLSHRIDYSLFFWANASFTNTSSSFISFPDKCSAGPLKESKGSEIKVLLTNLSGYPFYLMNELFSVDMRLE